MTVVSRGLGHEHSALPLFNDAKLHSYRRRCLKLLLCDDLLHRDRITFPVESAMLTRHHFLSSGRQGFARRRQGVSSGLVYDDHTWLLELGGLTAESDELRFLEFSCLQTRG